MRKKIIGVLLITSVTTSVFADGREQLKSLYLSSCIQVAIDYSNMMNDGRRAAYVAEAKRVCENIQKTRVNIFEEEMPFYNELKAEKERLKNKEREDKLDSLKYSEDSRILSEREKAIKNILNSKSLTDEQKNKFIKKIGGL